MKDQFNSPQEIPLIHSMDEPFTTDSYGLLNDQQISKLAKEGMITPFTPHIVRQEENRKVISYGCGSYGYDLRLSPDEFLVFRHEPGSMVDPKDFNVDHLEPAKLRHDEKGSYFGIPGHGYGLGFSLEKLEMPPDVTAIAVGKSTYARTALIANITPSEAGWKGHLTLEFSNSSPADVRIYANEGVVQLLFFRGKPCTKSYQDRAGGGKYQNQKAQVTLPTV